MQRWVLTNYVFKIATLVYKFLQSGHPSYFGSLLSTSCGTYNTGFNCPDKRFLNSIDLYINKKTLFGHSYVLMLPLFGMIYLMRSILPQPSPVSEKS